MSERPELRGRTAVVCGGGRGIGAATARTLAAAGASVVVISGSAAELGRVVLEVSDSGGTALALPGDVGDHEFLEQARARIEDELGPVEVVVSSAASLGPLAPAWAAQPEEFEAAVRTNLTGGFNVLRTFVPGMVERRFGRLVAVSSSAAATAVPSMGAYCATKAGFHQLHLVAAAELAGTGVRLDILLPGATDTDLQGELRTPAFRYAAQAEAAERQGLLRVPEHVAAAVVALLSDATRSVATVRDLGDPTSPCPAGD